MVPPARRVLDLESSRRLIVGRAPALQARPVLELVDQGLECGDLVVERAASRLGELDPSAGASALVALLDRDEPSVLQHGEVLREVAGGELEGGAEEAELDPSSLVGDREDAQPDALMDDVVEPVDGVIGRSCDGHSVPWVAARRMPPIRSTLPSITKWGRNAHGVGCGNQLMPTVETATSRYTTVTMSSGRLRSIHASSSSARPMTPAGLAIR